MERPQRRRVVGIVLIVLGIYFLSAYFFPTGGLSLALLGAFLLAGYALSERMPGFLISGCILLGLGMGIVLTDLLGDPWWPLILLGLGAGFCAIPSADRRQGWALVPGGILVLLGGLFLLTLQEIGLTWAFWDTIGRWWPVALVAVGIWILWRQWRLGPRR